MHVPCIYYLHLNKACAIKHCALNNLIYVHINCNIASLEVHFLKIVGNVFTSREAFIPFYCVFGIIYSNHLMHSKANANFYAINQCGLIKKFRYTNDLLMSVTDEF